VLVGLLLQLLVEFGELRLVGEDEQRVDGRHDDEVGGLGGFLDVGAGWLGHYSAPLVG
jgi:hypothetical protein